jgi:hypothetical protein
MPHDDCIVLILMVSSFPLGSSAPPSFPLPLSPVLSFLTHPTRNERIASKTSGRSSPKAPPNPDSSAEAHPQDHLPPIRPGPRSHPSSLLHSITFSPNGPYPIPSVPANTPRRVQMHKCTRRPAHHLHLPVSALDRLRIGAHRPLVGPVLIPYLPSLDSVLALDRPLVGPLLTACCFLLIACQPSI